jgi:hypothetical protein
MLMVQNSKGIKMFRIEFYTFVLQQRTEALLSGDNHYSQFPGNPLMNILSRI